jgi:hypothetical protein
MKKNLSLGIILILIGVIWLLSNLNVFSLSLINVFFHAMGKLWPLILIGAGVNLLLKENRNVKLITWLIVFAAIILYGLFTYSEGSYSYRYSPEYGLEFNLK